MSHYGGSHSQFLGSIELLLKCSSESKVPHEFGKFASIGDIIRRWLCEIAEFTYLALRALRNEGFGTSRYQRTVHKGN